MELQALPFFVTIASGVVGVYELDFLQLHTELIVPPGQYRAYAVRHKNEIYSYRFFTEDVSDKELAYVEKFSESIHAQWNVVLLADAKELPVLSENDKIKWDVAEIFNLDFEIRQDNAGSHHVVMVYDKIRDGFLAGTLMRRGDIVGFELKFDTVIDS